jgi:hypothetical protein
MESTSINKKTLNTVRVQYNADTYTRNSRTNKKIKKKEISKRSQ